MKTELCVFALVHPTEVKEKVETAITNIFPLKLEIQNFGTLQLYGKGGLESLRKFHLKLREERILDTARSVMFKGIEGNTIYFFINKQSAYVGRVNFPPQNETLGSIHIEIIVENKEELINIIDWLAPETIDGKPVLEIEL